VATRSATVQASRAQSLYTPSDQAKYSDQIFNALQALRLHDDNHVEGGWLSAPGTPSAQASGVGDTTWNVNVDAGRVVVDGVELTIGQADLSIHASSLLAGLVDGASAIARIVAKNAAGTVSLVAVKGTPATTGSEVAPTDADVNTAVSNVPWVEIGQTTLNRTGDATVTQTYDRVSRPRLAALDGAFAF
jgi:hypothetical protein